MPEVKATHRYLRTSAFKVREVLDLVRGLHVDEARAVLRNHPRGAARDVLKVLESAIANAEHNNQLPVDELFISTAFADEGMTLRRWRPRARGRATRIRKRTAHVTVAVDRLTDQQLAEIEAREERRSSSRSARVAASRRAQQEQEQETEAGSADESAEATEEEAPAAEEAPAESDETETQPEESGAETSEKATDESTEDADDTEAESSEEEEK